MLCGGNIDTRLLASVLMRELARDGRLSRLVVDLTDRPGQLASVATVIGKAGANVVEVYHQRVFTDLPAKGTSCISPSKRATGTTWRRPGSLKGAGFAVLLKGAAPARGPMGRAWRRDLAG